MTYQGVLTASYVFPTPPSIQVTTIIATMTLDSAIHSALNLPADVTATCAPHGGSGFSAVFKVTTSAGDSYFLKTGTGYAADLMYRGWWILPPWPAPLTSLPRRIHLA